MCRRVFAAAAALVVSSFFCAPLCPAQSAGSSSPARNGAPVATIDGQPIYESDLLPSVASQLRPLRSQEYEIEKQGLDRLIDQKLLEAEAKKKGIPTDRFLQQEVDSKVADPTDAEVNAFYLAEKNQLGNRTFADVKAQLKAQLKQAELQQARQDFYAGLRKRAQVAVLLAPPRTQVSYDPARVRGNANAPVMIVEFADFQCPYCQAVEPTVDAVYAKYKGQVAIAFRDLPLTQLHPFAEGAAEAARCAGEQGKFWEYHDLLFKDHRLDRNGLLDEARALELDDKKFQTCLDTSQYKPQIQADALDAMRAGVSGTPGFFINGSYLDGDLPEAAFDKAIQDALAAAQNKPAGN